MWEAALKNVCLLKHAERPLKPGCSSWEPRILFDLNLDLWLWDLRRFHVAALEVLQHTMTPSKWPNISRLSLLLLIRTVHLWVCLLDFWLLPLSLLSLLSPFVLLDIYTYRLTEHSELIFPKPQALNQKTQQCKHEILSPAWVGESHIAWI